MEKYHNYESWLKSKSIRSWSTYLSYMKQIEKDLGGMDLLKITSTPYLNKLIADLETRNVFRSRGESDRSNILSGFKKYIEYIKETKNTF